jgi:hypothetical protein
VFLNSATALIASRSGGWATGSDFGQTVAFVKQIQVVVLIEVDHFDVEIIQIQTHRSLLGKYGGGWLSLTISEGSLKP